MTRKLKALGLVLVGVLALVALAAASGWAGEEEEGQGKPKRFKVKDVSQAILTGEQTETTILTTAGGEIGCFYTHLEGTMIEPEEKELTITPTAKECETNGLQAHVEFNGCYYLFTLLKGSIETGAGKGRHTESPVHIVCPTGKSITTKVTVNGSTFCTITIPPQTPQKPIVDLKNFGSHVLFTSTVSGIHYQVTGGLGFCGETGKTLTDGKLDSEVKVSAWEDEEGTKGKKVVFEIYGTLAP